MIDSVLRLVVCILLLLLIRHCNCAHFCACVLLAQKSFVDTMQKQQRLRPQHCRKKSRIFASLSSLQKSESPSEQLQLDKKNKTFLSSFVAVEGSTAAAVAAPSLLLLLRCSTARKEGGKKSAPCLFLDLLNYLWTISETLERLRGFKPMRGEARLSVFRGFAVWRVLTFVLLAAESPSTACLEGAAAVANLFLA